MLKPHLVLISKLAEDSRIFSAIACELDLSFSQVSDRESVRSILQLFPDSVVIWNTEHPDPAVAKSSKSQSSIEETLRKLISPSRVFALSDRPLSRNQSLFLRAPLFQHYIVRRFLDPASDILARLLISALVPSPFGIRRYFAEGTSSQSVTIRRASERAVAVQAVDAFFKKKGLKGRMAARVAQATDELLMNAIFNAPHNGLGNPIRRLQARSDDFALGKNETVQLEVLCNDQYVGVCVTDKFGALDREVVLRLMGKNYRKQEYTPKDNQPGAGLGLYGIIEMGFSLAFSVKSGSRTDSMIFFPIGNGTMKSFREGFQFITFFGGVAYKRAELD